MSKPVDVLILGAGINGAGLFRDLCEQGLTCAIIDKADYGSGTSAAPSRLIHGGLKYLETGEFRLVAQSTLERNLLLRNAPHYVEPLATVIPLFSWLKGIPAALRTLFGAKTAPRSRGALLIKLGLSVYDFYGSRRRVMPRHELWSKRKALREVPPLSPRIVAAGLYYDAKISHPERLVFELVQDGLAASPGSLALNHTTLTSVVAGTLHFMAADGERHAIEPRIVINAAGPWIDKVNTALGQASKLIGGTKGSHILMDHPALLQALKGRMLYFEADDGRICLVYEYLGRALVGSTDIRMADPDAVTCDDGEIAYFLQSLRALLPTLTFDEGQIVYAYAGIRPLPTSDSSNPGFISRDHSAPVAEPVAGRPWPVVSLVGGKWTTFRGFAAEVADVVLARLEHPRRVSTEDLPIGGGRDFPGSTEARTAWFEAATRGGSSTTERAAVLLARYGTRSLALLQHERGTIPVSIGSYTLAEIAWIAEHEQVVHLDDLLFRRTALAMTTTLTLRTLETIGRTLGKTLGWSEERLKDEVRASLATLKKHRVPLG